MVLLSWDISSLMTAKEACLIAPSFVFLNYSTAVKIVTLSFDQYAAMISF